MVFDQKYPFHPASKSPECDTQQKRRRSRTTLFFLSNIGDKDIYDEYHDSSDEANDDMIVTTPCNSRLFSMS